MKMKVLRQLLIPLFCISIPLTGCTTTEIVTANARPAIQASVPVPANQILDIGIIPIGPGIPDDAKELDKGLIVPDVRRAESSYIAYHLKDTLELTGNWGAVRVTPQSSKAVDLEIRGEIIESTGERLKVAITVVDATDNVWFRKTYEDTASKYSYEKPRDDPFQDLYNDIANDLLAARKNLPGETLVLLKTVSNLRFASDLAPEAFGSYLVENKNGMTLAQLPAENDSMMQRVARIKEQEYLFVDTLDDYYSRFYREMRPSYNEWRHATYDEAIRLREIERQARTRLATGALLIVGGLYAASEGDSWATQAAAAGAVGGGIQAIRSGLQRKQEAEIHAASLKELGQSLGTEISPYVLDIEGKTIELSGTAQEQYVQWRGLLREIYEQETSFPAQ
ncbi:MAG: hypothetical protein ACI8Z1_000510 [Candidatus Azotimanducaceae bacterium]|jgi:hypothetical protein